MRSKKLSLGLNVVLAIFAATVLVAGVRASAQTEKVLFRLPAPPGGSSFGGPFAGLIFDASGNLYGTTWADGTHREGSVFEVTPKVGGGWTGKTLHNFVNNGDGTSPTSTLIMDSAGSLYGTTNRGGTGLNCSGSGNCGTVFKLTQQPGGGWAERILHEFTNNGTDGYSPFAGLIFDTAGNLYGTTNLGGTSGFGGTVFELTPTAGGNWTERVLYNFCSQSNCADGGGPYASLIFDAAGNLYGTTGSGGAFGGGTVFELAPTGGVWTESVLHSFTRQGPGGSLPNASLVFDAAGNLYGTTVFGGAGNCKTAGETGCGVVFELKTKTGGWTEKVLHAFNNNASDGHNPYASLIFGASGNLYGTTGFGGTGTCAVAGQIGCGTVFKLTPTADGIWTERILHRFNNNGADGYQPEGSLIFDASGNLYGTTVGSGTNNAGTVFEITP
jgi:uncharacterized repeat protein (TIGR03803 family)